MKTLLIVAVIILLLVTLVALRNTISKRKGNSIATAFKNLEENPRYQLMMQPP